MIYCFFNILQLILTVMDVWNKLTDDIHNASSVMLFRKQLKTLFFLRVLSRPFDGCILSCPEVCYVLTLPDMWILTLINVLGFARRF